MGTADLRAANGLKIEYRQTESLIPYAMNSRTHSESQVLQIAASIKEFGFTNPILIDEGNGLIAGHGRLMAAQVLGLEQVPCIVLSGLSPAQKTAYVIADNKLALNATWDYELLNAELTALTDLNFDIALTGFDEIENDLASIDYGLLDGDAVDKELADMAANVKKAIQIEFESDDYEQAIEVIKKYRQAEAYIGGILLETLLANEHELQ